MQMIQTDQKKSQNHQAQLDATWAQCSVRLLRPCQTPESDVKLGEMSGKLSPDDASRRTCPKSATATLDSDDHKTFLQLNMTIITNRTRDYCFLINNDDEEICTNTLSIAKINMYSHSHGSNKEQVRMTNKGCRVM